MTTSRPKARETENENQRPDKAGHPPRPATEPKGAEGSSNSGRTETDPATASRMAECKTAPGSLRGPLCYALRLA